MTRPLGFQNRVLDPGVEILLDFSWIVWQTQDRHYSLYHSSLCIHLQSSVRLWFPRQVAEIISFNDSIYYRHSKLLLFSFNSRNNRFGAVSDICSKLQSI